MTTVALILKPIGSGWVVATTDGRELAHFIGPFARYRAERYLHITEAPKAVRRTR
jgi:hypothetical protein